MRRLTRIEFLVLIVTCFFMSTSVLSLSSCGGEDVGTDAGNGNAGKNSAPVANAGPDQNVSTGSLVTLNGSASSDANGDAFTYTWSFTSRPDGSTATLSSPSAVNPTFTADKDGSFVLRLVVNDGQVDSAADSVTITATAASGNSAPVASAGPDQNVVTGSAVTLDGSGSSDANGDALTYTWSFTTRPDGSTAALSGSNAVNPTFTADADGSYVVSLVVNDGQVDSAADSVTITATAATQNSAPVANAGPDQSVSTGAQVTLDGSASIDANGDNLNYSWSITSTPDGSTATLSSSEAVHPWFTADKDGQYVISLVVNDGLDDSAPDTVTITASTSNVAPTADPGHDQNVVTGSLVTLDGSESSDANVGDTLTYNWTMTSTPDGSAATLSSSTVSNPTFTADRDGVYEISLVVNDGQLDSAADSVTITASTPVPVIHVPDTNQGDLPSVAGEDGDYNINSVSYTDNFDETITDNVTGLVWQKQDDATTRAWDDAKAYCDTNAAVLPGTEWRLPTRMELVGLLFFGTNVAPWINASYFQGTQSAYYWSAITEVDRTTHAWGVSFGNGYAMGITKTSSAYVRCVRGQSATSSYTDNGDTVTDNSTGLTWQKQDDAVARTWADALAYCEGLSFASNANWRLPNIKELSSLVDDLRYNPSADPLFTEAQPSKYWSSTTCNGFCTSSAWVVDFYRGYLATYISKTDANYVRCVSGQ